MLSSLLRPRNIYEPFTSTVPLEGTFRPVNDTGSPSVRRLLVGAAVAVAYFVAAKLGLRVAFVHASATAVWPPTGIALAAFLALGYRVWPGIFLGALVANLTTAGSLATSLGIAAGNTSEGLIGAYLLNRFSAGDESLSRLREIPKFVLFAATLSTMVSPTVGVIGLSLGGYADWRQFGAIWSTWWLGDAMGALIVTPLLLAWRRGFYLDRGRREWIEAGCMWLGVLLVGLVLFTGTFEIGARNYPMAFLCIPFVLWAAFRFDQREVSTVTLLLAAIAIYGALHGFGPFARRSANESLLLVQAFAGTLALLGLTVAALVQENRRAGEILEHAHATLKTRVQEQSASLDITASRLAEAYNELESFTYSVSHDLRTPLRSIRTFSDLLAKELTGGLSAEGVQHLERIRSASLRMSELIDGLLRVSRVAAVELHWEKVDVCGLAAEIIAGLRDGDPRRAVELVCTANGIWADGRLFRIVLDNLLSNAWKFTAKAARARIEIGDLPAQKRTIFVRDNGAGFDMAYVDKLFKAFERLHPSDEYPGTGIGLATVQRIIARHDGRIWAEGRPNEGATFYIELPERHV